MPFRSYRLFALAFALLAGFSGPSRGETPSGADGAGFNVTAVEVGAERDAPQVCFSFGGRLDKARAHAYAAFVEVTPPLPAPLSVVARDRTLCVEGLAHGATYTVTLRKGLPGADGQTLEAADSRTVEVPNRAPSLAFRGAGVILPRVGAEGLSLRAINVDRASLRVLRMADPALVEKIYAGRVGQSLSDWDLGEMVDKGALDRRPADNRRPQRSGCRHLPPCAAAGRPCPRRLSCHRRSRPPRAAGGEIHAAGGEIRTAGGNAHAADGK